ncbi:MAG: hypothetical protein P8M30_16130 [Planctomycetaceae bacterium]|jgi:hypothetical protein|nr:hypothetical protein [Planctomycetaceae bacterium]MDG2390839.1 hypothetical protein [Planctomycetaceae bacterium]
MSDRKFNFADGCAIVVLGGLCLVVSAYYLMPNLEAARGEARAGMTYNEVRYQHLVLNGIIDGDEHNPEKNDPWGEPYITETLPDSTIQVMSKGPNKTTPESGFDDDDIYTGMPEHPNAAVYRAKKRQGIFMLLVATVSWITLSILWWKFSKDV